MKKLIYILFFLFFTFLSKAQAPIAQFTATPLVICPNESIVFMNQSVAGNTSIIQWVWNFGDGSTSTLQNPSHIYTFAGTFSVTLVVTDLNGVADAEVKTGYITVNPKPNVQFTGNSNSCTLPVQATFTNQTSGGGNCTYLWNFGNGQSSTLQNPTSVLYNLANTYNVSLSATFTATGCHATLVKPITISDFTSNFSAPDSVCEGSTVNFIDNSTLGVNNWSWNFGNGQSSIYQNPSCTFNNPGIYNVTLSSENTNLNCSSSITKQIVIVAKPIVSFVSNSQHGCLPFHVTFNNTSVGAMSSLWSFGDGSTSTGNTPPIHTYSDFDTFSVSLSCIGLLGCSASATYNNYIYTAPLFAKFVAIDSNGCSPVEADLFDSSFCYYLAYDPIVTWLWNIEGVGVYNGQNPPPHVFSTGLYDVSLTVMTQNGCASTINRPNYIQVGEIDTVDFTISPYIQCAKAPYFFNDYTVINVPFDSSELVYAWFFGDGGTSINMNTSHGYAVDTGYFNVIHQTIFRGCVKEKVIDSALYIRAPIARFYLFDSTYIGYDASKFVVCNPDSFPLHLLMNDISIKGVVSDDVKLVWKWSDSLGVTNVFEDADLDADNDGSIEKVYNDYGVYQATQIVYNYTTGCTDSVIHEISISHIEPGFSVLNDSICFGDEIQFISTTTSLNPINTNRLEFFTYIDTILTTLTYLFDTTGTYYATLYSGNTEGCSASFTMPITVLDLPTANISASDNASCAPVLITFSNTSTANGNGVTNLNHFEWTFTDNSTQLTSALSENVSYSFLTQGNFNTSLTLVDSFGCSSDTATVVTSITLPIVHFSFDSVVCNQSEFQITNETVGFGALNYYWELDDDSLGNSEDIALMFNESIDSTILSTNHILTLYAIDENGCIDSLSKTVSVSMPFASFDYTATSANLNNNNYATCPPVFEDFENQSSSIGAFESNWLFGDGNSSVLQNPSNTYVFAGIYSVQLTMTDEYGCIDDTIIHNYLKIDGPIINSSVIPSINLCDNEYLFDTISTSNVYQFIWDFGDSTSANDTIIAHNFPNIGTYYPTVTVYDDLGCKVIYPLDTLVLNNQLMAFFVPSTIDGETNSPITFTDQSIFNVPGMNWNWQLGDFDSTIVNNNTNSDVIFSYSLPYTYNVILTVTDSNGCIDDYQMLIHIQGNVEAPNVFTSNNDGVNDQFMFPYDLFETFNATILNRWGNVVYEHQNEKGIYIWNGKNQKEEEAAAGVYFYLIEGVLLDGAPFKIAGEVTKIE
ncbi:MAG: PKD domain-containing protein [Flavobacteriia bacterium]|nr:PKD domain-containing protein [Flavobacteriia bacterium]